MVWGTAQYSLDRQRKPVKVERYQEGNEEDVSDADAAVQRAARALPRQPAYDPHEVVDACAEEHRVDEDVDQDVVVLDRA